MRRNKVFFMSLYQGTNTESNEIKSSPCSIQIPSNEQYQCVNGSIYRSTSTEDVAIISPRYSPSSNNNIGQIGNNNIRQYSHKQNCNNLTGCSSHHLSLCKSETIVEGERRNSSDSAFRNDDEQNSACWKWNENVFYKGIQKKKKKNCKQKFTLFDSENGYTFHLYHPTTNTCNNNTCITNNNNNYINPQLGRVEKICSSNDAPTTTTLAKVKLISNQTQTEKVCFSVAAKQRIIRTSISINELLN
ncbi:hypothetical protein ABK040_000572 [Willaertia magna]